MISIIAGGILFLVGVTVGACLAGLYPKQHDAEFREYLRREYGTKK